MWMENPHPVSPSLYFLGKLPIRRDKGGATSGFLLIEKAGQLPPGRGRPRHTAIRPFRLTAISAAA